MKEKKIKTKVMKTVIFLLALALCSIFTAEGAGNSVTNASLNYVYNGTDWIPWLATAEGKPKVELTVSPTTVPSARAYLSASQSISYDTWTKVNLDTENYDLGGDFDTTNKRFVAPVSGYYQVSGAMSIYPIYDSASVRYGIAIYKNGVLAVYSTRATTVKTWQGVSISDVFYLTANDYLELYVWHTETVDREVAAGTTATFMSIRFLPRGQIGVGSDLALTGDLSTGGTVKTDSLTIDAQETDINMNNKKITNVTDPTTAQDAATKNYVDKGAHCKIRLETEQTNLADGVYTIVALDTLYHDSRGDMADLANNRIVIKVAGYYLIHGVIRYRPMVADKYFRCGIELNGAGYGNIAEVFGHSSNTNYLSVQATTIRYLNVDDYIKLAARQHTGVNTVDILQGSYITYLEVSLLSIA